MPRPRWAALVAAVVLVTAGVAVSAIKVTGDDDVDRGPAERPELGDAEQLAGLGGDIRSEPRHGDRLVDLHLGGSDDYDLRAYDVRTGADGTIHLLTGWFDREHGEHRGIVVRIDADLVVDTPVPYVDTRPRHLAVAPNGHTALIGTISRVIEFEPPQRRWGLPQLGLSPLSGSHTPDGTLVVSSIAGPEIVAVDPDGTVEHLLAPTGSPAPAPARLDSDTARLTVVALTDGRTAFATNAPDDPDLDGRLFLLDGATLQPLDLPGTDPIRRIFPGPDDTLLALEGPHITHIDPHTRTTHRLIDLSEIADELAPASHDWPPHQEISATAHGHDLLFTAHYQLWRLPDAFA